MIDIEAVLIEKPDDGNVIIGQTHFIKTVEDLYEAMVNSVPAIKFGIGFCEASQDRLVRVDGNDEDLVQLAADNAMRIGAGHVFVIIMKDAFPINVLGAVKSVPEVCNVFCATANEVEVLVAKTPRGRGVVGVVDGQTPVAVETEDHVKKRKEFLRAIGYKR
jgi:adenosine/AMP kinase